MMNNDLENIFDKALLELQNGASLEAALLKCQPKQVHLAEGLQLAEKLGKFPKKTVPSPIMQRKYSLMPIKTTWYHWLHFSRWIAASTSLILLLSAIAGTGYAAYNSMPGQALFAIKKTAENLQLQFATSPEKKAALQVEFSKKRLIEAEKILKNPDVKPEIAKAAVQELSEQTKSTVNTLVLINKISPDPQKTKTLVKTLETIATDQEKLAKEVKTEATKDIVSNVEASAKVISNYIQIATNELEKYEKTNQPTDNNKILGTAAGSSTTTLTSDLETVSKDGKASTSTTTLKTLAQPIEEQQPEPTNPNIANGGYIFETPEPQYIPSSTQP